MAKMFYHKSLVGLLYEIVIFLNKLITFVVTDYLRIESGPQKNIKKLHIKNKW